MSACPVGDVVLRPIQLEDRPVLDVVLRRAALPHCEYTFATLWCWRNYQRLRWGWLDGDWLVLRVCGPDGIERYLAPVGSGDPRDAVAWCLRDLAAEGHDPTLCLVPARITGALGAEFAVVPDPDNADYVYERAALSALPGRRYARKRNHVHRFEREHPGWSFGALRPDDLGACRVLAAAWGVGSSEHPMQAHEEAALRDCLDAWGCLDLTGGVLWAEGRIVGFSIGEPLMDDTFVVHHERADRAVEGAHQALCRAFAASLPPRFVWIDREQDLGVPGLRASKSSYFQARQEQVATVVWAR